MTQFIRWQGLLIAGLGIWLLVSPWIPGLDDGSPAMWNAVIARTLLGAPAIGSFFVSRTRQQWAQGALGAWLIASPRLLEFNAPEQPMLNALAVGVALLALAAWSWLASKRAASRRPVAPASRTDLDVPAAAPAR